MSAEGEGEREGERVNKERQGRRLWSVCVLRKRSQRQDACRRRTRADGERVPTESTRDASGQQWANAGRDVATPFSFFFINLGIVCVSVVEALSGKLVLFKCSDCRVVGCSAFSLLCLLCL